MKSVFSLLLVFSAPAFAAPVCGSAEGSAFARAADRFLVGEISTVELEESRLSLYRALHACGVLSKNEYCSVAILSTAIYAQGVEAEFRVGQRTRSEVDAAARRLQSLRTSCGR